MTEIDSMYQTLLQAMVDYPTRDNVLPKYQIVLNELDAIICKIKKSHDFASANKYFDQLQEIQAPLSRLVFKEKIDDYDSINKFVRDFDRIDDKELRQEMFELIQEGKYSIHDE